MSILFNGTTSKATWTGNIRSSFPMTVFAWVKLNASGMSKANVVFGTGEVGSGVPFARTTLNDGVALARLQSYYGGSQVAESTSSIAQDVWMPVMMVLTSDTSRTIYFRSGAAVTNTETSCALSTMARFCLGYGPQTDQHFLAGELAEVAVWGAALGSTEYSSLSGGSLPETVASGSLVEHWKLENAADLTGTVSRTLTGVDLADGGSHPVSRSSDTTAPTLSSASVSSVGTTTATGNVTTNEGNGTLYSVVSTSATPPSVAQIQAGQNASGAAAVWSGNQAVSSTGAKTFSITGLANSTSYYAYFQHKDAANNNSTVVSSAQFTTTSPPTITITDLKDLTTGTLRASETGVTAIINNVTTGALVVKLTGLNSTAGGDMSISDASLAASTQYRVTIILSDGSEGTWKYTTS